MSTNGHELNARQKAFVNAYLEKQNATAAALTAGYSEKTARQAGRRLLANVDIKSALRARGAAALARLEVTEDMVMQELAAIAFSNVKRFSRWTPDGELEVIGSDEIPDALAAAIESIDEKTVKSENKDGSRTYSVTKRRLKLYNKLDALKTIAEYLGLTDTMAPKVTVHLITGIDRTPAPVDVEAEPVVENPPENRVPEP